MAPTRLDSIADLESFFDRIDLVSDDSGEWFLRIAGSTPSGSTGPGINSGGPYVYSETSGGNSTSIPINSALTVNTATMSAWVGSGRILSLRASIAGAFINTTTPGLSVQGRVSNADNFAEIELLEGWSFSNFGYIAGGTLTDSAGDTQDIELNGGWVDYEVTIPDNYTEVRLQVIPHINGFSQHDAALWQVEFINGLAADPPDRPAAPSVIALNDSTLRAIGVAPANNGAIITSYDWRYRERGVGDPWQDLFNEVSLIQTISGLDASTEYEFSFRATNSEGDSPYSPRGRAFTDAPGNVLPTVTISASQTVVNGFQTVNLTSSTDDPDGDVTDFLWSATGGTIADDTAEATTWTAPAAGSASATYFISLTITDDQNATATDTISITVRAVPEPRSPQRALRTIVEIDLPDNALSLRFSERNFIVGDTFYEGRLLLVPSITWTLGSILQPHLEIPEIPLHFSDAPQLIPEGRNLGHLIRSHDFFRDATIRIKAGEVGGAFVQVFRGHVLEGSIRIEDHTVALQVEAEANIATAVPLPALEGGAWNLIGELRDHQSQHTLGRWFGDTSRQIRDVRSTPYFEIYSVQAGPNIIVPDRDGSTNHGVDYWAQPTTGSRLVDRTRDHTFSSSTTGFLRLRRPRLDTGNVPIDASEFRLAEERTDNTIILHAFSSDFTQAGDWASSSLGTVTYDSRNSSGPNTTDRMLYSVTALTFPAGARLRYQWRPPETVGTFHVVDLARNFMSKSGVSDADIDTDAFDDLKEDLTDAGSGGLDWLTRGVFSREEAGLDQVARLLADAFCDLGLTQAGLLRPVRRNLITPANPVVIQELDFLPRQIGGREWVLYVDPERLRTTKVYLQYDYDYDARRYQENAELEDEDTPVGLVYPRRLQSPYVFAGTEVQIRGQWHLDRFSGNILVLQGSVQIDEMLDVGDIIRAHLPVLEQDGALFQIRELTRDLVDGTHHFVALGGKVQT